MEAACIAFGALGALVGASVASLGWWVHTRPQTVDLPEEAVIPVSRLVGALSSWRAYMSMGKVETHTLYEVTVLMINAPSERITGSPEDVEVFLEHLICKLPQDRAVDSLRVVRHDSALDEGVVPAAFLRAS